MANEKKFERRLAAILVADVVGFSALVGRDEERAIRAFKSHMSVLELLIALHSGRIFKSTGDGFLVEFSSVVNAVSCADAMQKKMCERNAQGKIAKPIEFRMGVHCGDIIADGQDLLGDGVNIAARLESVSAPGGIAVSARVRDDVAGKLDIVFESKGLVELKNIADPVHVYCIGPQTLTPLVVGISLPDKPSIAVLPFDNISDEDKDEYFADGVTEDITVALSHVPWVFVIARNSSYSYKGLSVDVRRIGSELGVRYILEGSIRRSSNRLRISAELIDAETGAHIWAKRYDGVLEDVFDLQDEVSTEVVSSIAPEIQSAEIKRVLRKQPKNMNAYDMYLRGQHALHLGRIEDATEWFEASLAEAPEFAKARAKLAWISTVWHYFGKSPSGDDRIKSLELARGALEQDTDDSEVLAYSGYTIGFLDRKPAYGLDLVEQAIDKSPSFAWAWASSSLLYSYIAAADQALERARVALRVSPRDPFAFRTYIAVSLANIVKGDYEALLRSGDKGISLNPRAINFHYHRAIALAQLGRMNEAENARNLVLEIDPGFRISEYISYCRDEIGVSDGLNVPLENGLRMVGFPE
ncbi:adenylate/guanylate cyclase domain-containing protein [Ruegeria atlantica]|uniref:Putative PEP-CTERM system TPR-repeat lipoprotein n=1 Tax=Ruegeria atlantica TaxID=81569 RepID=A0A0P1EB52_9RHOB|nr:adenylate/guanylate cyclase domain-containing protein [Ruegeria atlantica]CUH45865.1 putative PEP-CTERM system TPR-repeat lipoprotein [Ruegeria atlantica]